MLTSESFQGLCARKQGLKKNAIGRERPEKHLEEISGLHNYDNSSQKGPSLRFLWILFPLSVEHPPKAKQPSLPWRLPITTLLSLCIIKEDNSIINLPGVTFLF